MARATSIFGSDLRRLFDGRRWGNPSPYPPADKTPPRFVLWSDHERRYFFRFATLNGRWEDQWIEKDAQAKVFRTAAAAEEFAKLNSLRRVAVIRKR